MRAIIDIRVARHGWNVATVNFDDDGNVVQRLFPLAGWAICDGETPAVWPCWHEPASGVALNTGENDDAIEIVPPGGEPDWAALRADARAAMLRREGLR